MALIVQKYGGTSAGDADKIKNVARRIAARREKGDEPVVVGLGTGPPPRHLLALARIFAVAPQRIHKELGEGKIVIVAGFQGITEEMDIATLGRGGSDTTAVALAAALKAERCDIYTDVARIYTTDPRGD